MSPSINSTKFTKEELKLASASTVVSSRPVTFEAGLPQSVADTVVPALYDATQATLRGLSRFKDKLRPGSSTHAGRSSMKISDTFPNSKQNTARWVEVRKSAASLQKANKEADDNEDPTQQADFDQKRDELIEELEEHRYAFYLPETVPRTGPRIEAYCSAILKYEHPIPSLGEAVSRDYELFHEQAGSKGGIGDRVGFISVEEVKPGDD